VATLGSDTGGSIRQPASFCGVVGVLPTYGRVSRYGLIAFASSLDRVGPFAANVRDAATLLGVIAGHDPKDATSSPAPVPDYAAESDKPVEGPAHRRSGGVLRRGARPGGARGHRAGIAALKAAGCEIKPVSLPHTKYAVPTYYLIATAEASANLARFDGVRYGYRSPAPRRSPTCTALARRGLRRRGQAPHPARHLRALGRLLRRLLPEGAAGAPLLAEEFLRAFAEVDAIVAPTAPTPAFKLGEKTGDPLAMYLADIYTVTASLAGICGVTVPCGATKAGLPVGMQVLARI
jgi:aspartyl-tRNA(Asn)/glutamyl-tRNA(Gln) amidotransferase subunit A